MGLAFLVPAFLLGLAAVAVPVVLHLLNRERKETVGFPSLMFIERVQYRSVRRQALRHPLLLALRCLALVLLAAAFARPFLRREQPPFVGAGAARELVVLLDRSYSMGLDGRWERARHAVAAELAGMTPADRVTLVAFDERAVAVAGPASEAAVLRPALDALRPGHRATRLGPALVAAREVLAASDRPRREVLLVSDLQRSAWDGRAEGRLPANVAVRVADLGAAAQANAMVAGVELARERDGPGRRVAVVARVANRDSTPVRGRAVSLELQGRTIETRQVDLPARGTAMVRFSATAVPAGASRALVRLAPDALPEDDVFHFALSRGQALRVLVLTDRDAPARRSLYLGRALALGDKPPFEAEVRSVTAAMPAEIGAADVIVLNDAAFPGGALGRAVVAHVHAGAGLIVVLGERGDPRRWPAEAAALLPASARDLTDRSSDNGGRIGTLERSHPIFAPFTAARSGDFTTARFLRYRPLALADSATALVHFDDGSIALADGRAGRGTVLVWASTLDDFWNDLAVQPVYLPFVHGLVRYAAGYTPEPASRTVGQLVDLSGRDSATAVATVLTPAGDRQRRGRDSAALELGEPGFYELLSERGESVRLVGVNADRAESELAAWNAQELAATLVSTDSLAETASQAAALAPAERERKQRVWWFLLIAAAAVLLAELALANRVREVEAR
jgi:hypothetical protein